MTTAEVATMVSSFGFTNWRYDHFSQTPAPPYVVYYYPSENDVFADDANYVNRRQLFIELFTKQKDATSEAAIETKLAAEFAEASPEVEKLRRLVKGLNAEAMLAKRVALRNQQKVEQLEKKLKSVTPNRRKRR